MTPRIFAALITVAALLATPTASAQDENADDPAAIEARRVFTEGRAHEAAQRYALAAERYQQAYEVMRRAALERAAVALFWAGRALYHVAGRERDARETFRGFLDSSTLLTEDAQVRDWRSEALERIAELDARIGAAPEPDGAQALSSPEPEPEPGPEPDPVETETTRSISPIGPIVLGVGSATLLAGVIVAGLTLAEDASLVAMCPDDVCPETARGTSETVENLALTADVLLIGGGLIAVTGLLLTLVLYDEADPVRVTAACGMSSCGLAIAGAF